MPDDTRFYINGINGDTGEYLSPPLKASDVAAFVKGELRQPAIERFLANVWRKLKKKTLGRELPVGVDAANVAQAGWAVVFHADENQAVKDALAPLITHRRTLAGDDTKVKVLEYRDGEEYNTWLRRYNVAVGRKELSKVPYYLLLVGSPERMPFLFGQLLSVDYVVGRLHFDQPAQYAAYVQSVISYEKDVCAPNSKEAVFFGTRHSFDPATQLSADHLINPLADGVPATAADPASPAVAAPWGFRTRKIWGAAATKAALAEVFAPPAGSKPPAFLFTASHGMGWLSPNARQMKEQGALICQDWPGFGNIKPAHYFSAANLAPESRIHGLIAFHFACFGAGTPALDRFTSQPGQPPARIAGSSFMAALPSALLCHGNGAALACIGHVERAWGYSIQSSGAIYSIGAFRNAISHILHGDPVGLALESFAGLYASLSTELSAKLEKLRFNAVVADDELATSWMERNDAEGYLLLGDPAVRLRVNDLS
jgi:hypothetical protein